MCNNTVCGLRRVSAVQHINEDLQKSQHADQHQSVESIKLTKSMRKTSNVQKVFEEENAGEEGEESDGGQGNESDNERESKDRDEHGGGDRGGDDHEEHEAHDRDGDNDNTENVEGGSSDGDDESSDGNREHDEGHDSGDDDEDNNKIYDEDEEEREEDEITEDQEGEIPEDQEDEEELSEDWRGKEELDSGDGVDDKKERLQTERRVWNDDEEGNEEQEESKSVRDLQNEPSSYGSNEEVNMEENSDSNDEISADEEQEEDSNNNANTKKTQDVGEGTQADQSTRNAKYKGIYDTIFGEEVEDSKKESGGENVAEPGEDRGDASENESGLSATHSLPSSADEQSIAEDGEIEEDATDGNTPGKQETLEDVEMKDEDTGEGDGPDREQLFGDSHDSLEEADSHEVSEATEATEVRDSGEENEESQAGEKENHEVAKKLKEDEEGDVEDDVHTRDHLDVVEDGKSEQEQEEREQHKQDAELDSEEGEGEDEDEEPGEDEDAVPVKYGEEKDHLDCWSLEEVEALAKEVERTKLLSSDEIFKSESDIPNVLREKVEFEIDSLVEECQQQMEKRAGMTANVHSDIKLLLAYLASEASFLRIGEESGGAIQSEVSKIKRERENIEEALYAMRVDIEEVRDHIANEENRRKETGKVRQAREEELKEVNEEIAGESFLLKELVKEIEKSKSAELEVRRLLDLKRMEQAASLPGIVTVPTLDTLVRDVRSISSVVDLEFPNGTEAVGESLTSSEANGVLNGVVVEEDLADVVVGAGLSRRDNEIEMLRTELDANIREAREWQELSQTTKAKRLLTERARIRLEADLEHRAAMTTMSRMKSTGHATRKSSKAKRSDKGAGRSRAEKSTGKIGASGLKKKSAMHRQGKV